MLSNSWHVFFFYVYIIYIHGITEYCLKKIKQWDQDSSLFEQIQAPKVAVLLHFKEEGALTGRSPTTLKYTNFVNNEKPPKTI